MATITATHPLIEADQLCDYIPFLSTVTNLVDLFLKYVILETEENYANPLYTYLQDKNTLRCLTLLVPVLGNVLIAIFDVLQPSSHDAEHVNTLSEEEINQAVERMRENPSEFEHLREELRDNRQVVLAAVLRSPHSLGYASENIRDDFDIILLVVRANGYALKHASDRLKNNREIVLAAVKNTHEPDGSIFLQGTAIGYADINLRNDREIALRAVRDPEAFQYLSNRLQNDPEIRSAAGVNV